jgi:hypothetical protein
VLKRIRGKQRFLAVIRHSSAAKGLYPFSAARENRKPPEMTLRGWVETSRSRILKKKTSRKNEDECRES